MTRVGVTGHQSIPSPAIALIEQSIRVVLSELPAPLAGYSSLAAGADQLFARIVLEVGGQLHAIIPAENYDSTLVGTDLAEYRRLFEAATNVEQLPFVEPNEDAYDAAGRVVVDRSDLLLAIWDGEPARGRGGTADAVDYARSTCVPVDVIWPAGMTR